MATVKLIDHEMCDFSSCVLDATHEVRNRDDYVVGCYCVIHATHTWYEIDELEKKKRDGAE